MTKKLDTLPPDPKAAFAKVFANLDGIKGMTAWGRTHRTLFYTLYSKLISQPAQQTNVNVNVHHTNEDPRKSLEQAFLRVIAARKAGGADPAVIVDGERVYDAAPHGAAVVVDARANRELPAPAS